MKNDFLHRLNEFLEKETENNDDYTNALLINAVEVDRNGRPTGTLSKVIAPPFTALGMCDYIQEAVGKLRESIYNKLVQEVETDSDSDSNPIPEMFKNLPPGAIEILSKYHNELKEALENGDGETLERIKNKIYEEWKKLKDSDDPDEFNMSDFTGGSI